MKKIILPFLSFLVISFSSWGQTTRIVVQNGQKFKVESSNKVTSSAEVMGQTMETNLDAKSITEYQVVNNSADAIDLQSTITKLLMSSSAMGQSNSFDSDKKDNEGPLAETLTGMINKAKKITIDSKGKITMQDPSTPNATAMMSGGLGGNQSTTDLYVPALLGKEIKAGDSFNDVSTVNKEKYNSKDSGTYSITKIENGVASISYAGTQVVSATLEQMGMEMQSTSNNIVKSEMLVDITTGLVLMKATVTESTISVDAGGMTIPATGKTITTVKVTPVQ